LDARLENTYDQGHIKHAKNVCFKKLFKTEDNTIKSKDEVLAVFSQAGVELPQEIVSTCNSGMTATYLMAALEHYNLA